jgi:hypothetical protein
MQHNTNMQQQQPQNSSLFTTPYYYENNGSQYDLDSAYTFDDTIEGAAADNDSDMYCPNYSSFENLTYLNVSCDTALNFSVPLYGE